MRTPLAWTLRVTISPWNSLLLDFLKEPMVAISLLLGCSSPRPLRPRWRSSAAGDRRRTRRAEAQRRMAAARLSWLARNGRRRVPALAGWQAQGKKVSPPPLRQGDRGFAVLRRDHAIKRPRGLRARQPCKEKTWQTWSAQEVRRDGRRNRNPGVRKGGRSHPGSAPALALQTPGSVGCGQRCRSIDAVARAALLTVRFDDRQPLSPNRIHDEARPQLSLAARAAGNGDPKPASSPRSGIGRDGERQAHPGRGSDRDRTDQRKRSLPQLCRYADLRETKGCVITRHGGRHGEHECDSGADQWQAERRDRNLARREGEGSGNQADKESADLTGAAVVGGNTCGNGNEDGQGMDRKREQQPE